MMGTNNAKENAMTNEALWSLLADLWLTRKGVDELQDRRMALENLDRIIATVEAALPGAPAPAEKEAPRADVRDGPYTCTSCCANTWNDDDYCDDCKRIVREELEGSQPAEAPTASAVADEARIRAEVWSEAIAICEELPDCSAGYIAQKMRDAEIARLTAPGAGGKR